MLHAPYFQATDKYHPQYLSLADIRGTGTADFGSEDNWNDAAWQTSHKGDGSAVQNYTQKYSYDEVGNILELQHIAGSGSYTRTYEINTNSNGLLSTEVGSNTYAYSHDERGNMTKMPHLDSMAWNTQNELKSILKGNEPTYYQYSGGERVRKFTDKGIIKEERIYLGSYEIYRKYVNNVLDIERTTVHVSDDTGRIAMLEARTVGTDPSLTFLQRYRSEEHTSELQSRPHLVCRLLLEKKNTELCVPRRVSARAIHAIVLAARRPDGLLPASVLRSIASQVLSLTVIHHGSVPTANAFLQ